MKEFSAPWLLLLMVTLVVASIPASADTALTFHESFVWESQERSGEKTQKIEIILAKDRARYEAPREILLLDIAAKQLFILDPEESRYSAVDHPLRLEDHAESESEKSALAHYSDPRVEVEDTGEVEKIGPWTARKYRVFIYDQFVDQEATVWMSTEPEVDIEFLNALLLDYNALIPSRRLWLERVLEHGGIPVKIEEVRRSEAGAWIGDRTLNHTISLLSLEDREVAPDLYEVPPGFENRPLDLSRYFGVKVHRH